MCVRLLIVAAADAGARQGRSWGVAAFWIGVLVIALPIGYQLIGARAAEADRFWLVVLLAMALYAVKILQSPWPYLPRRAGAIPQCRRYPAQRETADAESSGQGLRLLPGAVDRHCRAVEVERPEYLHVRHHHRGACARSSDRGAFRAATERHKVGARGRNRSAHLQCNQTSSSLSGVVRRRDVCLGFAALMALWTTSRATSLGRDGWGTFFLP